MVQFSILFSPSVADKLVNAKDGKQAQGNKGALDDTLADIIRSDLSRIRWQHRCCGRYRCDCAG